MAVRLSVNVNKVATLRNSRGGEVPSVVEAVDACLAAGATGITVHPRADQRHIRPADVRDIAERVATLRGRVEYNIEGDPRPEFLAMVHDVRPDQCTLVPVVPGELTSQGGWGPDVDDDKLGESIARLKADGIRVSVFVDPEEAPIRWAARLGADRVELFTEPFAQAFARSERDGLTSFQRYATAADVASKVGLGINAGHDLDLHNLVLFRRLPHLLEVSIGHALMARALLVGLPVVVREYLELLAAPLDA